LADQRISQLTRLTKAGAAAGDLVPVADISASESKAITLKDLVAAGIDLVDAGEIDLSKLDQASVTKLGTGALADGAATAAKLAADSATAVAGAAPITGNHRGRGWFNSSTGNLQVWDGAAFAQVVLPTAGIGDLQVTTGKLADGAVTTAKVSPLGSAAYAAGSVNTAALADLGVTTGKIALGAITAARLAAGAIETAALAPAAVTYSKLQNLSGTDLLLGRASEGAGTVEEIPLTAQGRALIAGLSAEEQRNTLGLGTLATASGTWANGSSFSGTSSGNNTGDQTITLTGDVTGSGTETFAATIGDGAITELKYAALSIPTGALQDDSITAAKMADQSAAVVSNATPSGDGAFVGQQWIHTSTAAVYSWIGLEWLKHDSGGLLATDVPNLDATKIVSGEFPADRLAAAAVTRTKLANYAIGSIGEVFPTADFISQLHFNPLNKTFYMWDGNVYQPIGISSGAVVFAGTYNADDNKVDTVTSAGQALGLTVGSALPAAAAANAGHYVVVSESGTGTSPAPTSALAPPDILLSTGNEWAEIDVSSGYTAQSAINVAFTPAGTIAASNVQAAIEEVSGDVGAANTLAAAALPKAGGTVTGQLLIGTAGSLVFEGSVDDGFETAVAVANPTADRTVTIPNETGTIVTTGSSGVVTNAMVANNAAIALSKLATGALPTAITVASANIVDGTIVDADINASAGITLAKLGTGALPTTITIASANIVDGTIVNADINAAAAIAGSKISPDFDANVRIGQASTDIPGAGNNTYGISLRTSGNGYFSAQDAIAGLFNRSNDGSIISIRRAGTQVGSISVTASATTYGTSSDYRLKENLKPLTGAIERLFQLPVYRGNFIAAPGQEVDMFLAHEAAEVVPNAVQGEKDGAEYQAMDHSKLVPLLWAALQETIARLALIEASIA
jgi:hypothetical protein